MGCGDSCFQTCGPDECMVKSGKSLLHTFNIIMIIIFFKWPKLASILFFQRTISHPLKAPNDIFRK